MVLKLGGGGSIWTNDLLVMSQTSYQAALPRDVCSYYNLQRFFCQIFTPRIQFPYLIKFQYLIS